MRLVGLLCPYMNIAVPCCTETYTVFCTSYFVVVLINVLYYTSTDYLIIVLYQYLFSTGIVPVFIVVLRCIDSSHFFASKYYNTTYPGGGGEGDCSRAQKPR